jgi:hypothetical protein
MTISRRHYETRSFEQIGQIVYKQEINENTTVYLFHTPANRICGYVWHFGLGGEALRGIGLERWKNKAGY